MAKTHKPMTELIQAATRARKNAYAPYSGFRVGAALRGQSGKIYAGCNVENAAFSPTICAERAALVKAVSEGERLFTALAVVTDTPAPTPPCGVCRQVLVEFAPPDLEVVMATVDGRTEQTRLENLLPGAFTGKSLQDKRGDADG